MFISRVSGHLNEVLELKTVVLELVERVRALTEDSSYGSALLLIYQHIDGETTNPQKKKIAKLIDELSTPGEDLEARLARLRSTLVKKLPKEAQRLLRSLAQEPAPLMLPLKLDKGKSLPLTGEITFLIGGSFSAQLAIQAMKASSIPTAWRLDIPASDAITRFAVCGELGTHASLAGPAAHGSIAFSTAARASAEANLIYQFDENAEVIDALIAAGKDRVLPWKLKDLDEHLVPVQAANHCEGLRRAQLQVGGSLDLGGEIGIGRLWSHEISESAGGRVQTVALSAKAGASFGFALKRQGQFLLIAEKDSEGLTVSIDKGKESRFRSTLDVGAEIEVSGLDKIAAPYVAMLFDDPADLLGELDLWANPGDLAIEKLKQVLNVNEDSWRSDVGRLLLGETSAPEVASAYGGKVAQKLTQLLNEKVPYWGRSDEEVAGELTMRLIESLGASDRLGETADEKLKPKLEEALAEISADLKSKVNKTVKSVAEATGKALEEVLSPLEDIGEDVVAAKQALNKRGNRLAEPVTRLLQQYQAKRNRLIEGIEKAAKFKVGMAYLREASATAGQNSIVSFRIRTVNEVTEGLYWSLMTGKIGQVWSDLMAAEKNGHIDQLTGRFDAMSSAKKTTGFAVTFMDESLSIQRAIESDVNVSLDATGNVMVASSALSQSQTIEAFGVTRQTSAVGAYQLSDLTNCAALPTPVGVSLSLGEKDGLRDDELEDFLGSLESDRLDVPLIAPGATGRAVAAYRQARDFSGGLKRTRVDVSFPLDRSALRRLGNREMTIEHVTDLACEYLVDLSLTDNERRGLLAEFARKEGLPQFRAVQVLGSGSSTSRGLEKLIRRIGSLPSGDTDPGPRLVADAIAIRKSAEALGEVVAAIKALVNESDKLFDRTGNPQEISASVRDVIEDINDRIHNGLKLWLKARLPLSGLFTEAVPTQTVALLALLMRLSGDDSGALVPVVSVSFADTESKLLVV